MPDAERYQTPEVAGKAILAAVLGFLVFCGLVMGVSALFVGRELHNSQPASPHVFAAPRLETREGETLDGLRAFQQKRLDTYGWVDRERGLVRIPIARAMDLLAGEADRGYDPREAAK